MQAVAKSSISGPTAPATRATPAPDGAPFASLLDAAAAAPEPGAATIAPNLNAPLTGVGSAPVAYALATPGRMGGAGEAAAPELVGRSADAGDPSLAPGASISSVVGRQAKTAPAASKRSPQAVGPVASATRPTIEASAPVPVSAPSNPLIVAGPVSRPLATPTGQSATPGPDGSGSLDLTATAGGVLLSAVPARRPADAPVMTKPGASGPETLAQAPIAGLVAPLIAAPAPAVPIVAVPILAAPALVRATEANGPAVAAQVAPAVLRVLTGAAGPSLTLHLNPAELGAIHITLARLPEGGAGVSLSVERPQTLQMLRDDMAHLHAALDSAGVPSANRTVSLVIEPVPQAEVAGVPMQGAGAEGGADTGAGERRPAPEVRYVAATSWPGTGEDATEPASPRRAWPRAGIDITA